MTNKTCTKCASYLLDHDSHKRCPTCGAGFVNVDYVTPAPLISDAIGEGLPTTTALYRKVKFNKDFILVACDE